MIRSLYIASTGMLVQRKKMDVLVNNIVNGETTGYKSGKLLSRSFQEMMIQRINDPAVLNYSNEIGPLGTGIHIDEIITDFEQGPLEETGRAADLAISGDGFFVVATPAGNRYTRDGSFAVSSDGYLVNSDGWPVMGENGRIYVGRGEFSVDAKGNVAVDGQPAGRLQLVTFADPASLRKDGNNLYVNYGGSAVVAAGNAAVSQGFLESSNVDLSESMVDMIEISRTYETNQRIVKMLDESLGKAVNEVGRV